MKIREIMTERPEACTPSTDLAAAAMIMWRNDCGFVPVVSEDRSKTLGAITDRDICIAVATRHARPEELRVGEVMSGRLVSVTPDDDIEHATDLMRYEQLRRLPVVGPGDELEGVVTLRDILMRAGPAKGRRHPGVSSEQIVQAMRGICERRESQENTERQYVLATTA
jgi:CBS domain-containing protein